MVCKYCNISFTPYHKMQITCGSKECLNKYHKEYRKTHTNQIREYKNKNKCYLNEYNKKYYKKNRIHINESDKEYNIQHRQQIKERKKEYYIKYKDKINKYGKEYQKNRKQTDPIFVMRLRIRDRFRKVIKKNKYTELYGIRIQDIINHIGPCPGNLSEYYIDHIKPLSSFDLTKEIEIQKAFAPENHQWLTKEDNLRKGDRYGLRI